MAHKRRMVAQIKKALHPSVSSLNRRRLIEYVYGTAHSMSIDWVP